jgi:hypothetical protein
MLVETTANAGYCVFSTCCEPYQKPKTITTINTIIKTVWKYSFFHNCLTVVTANVLPSVIGSVVVDLGFRVLKLNAFKLEK